MNILLLLCSLIHAVIIVVVVYSDTYSSTVRSSKPHQRSLFCLFHTGLDNDSLFDRTDFGFKMLKLTLSWHYIQSGARPLAL